MKIKRWLRELRKLGEPGRVVHTEKYWCTDFYPHYLELVEDIVYEEPRKGLPWARGAVTLAVLIAEPQQRQRLASAYAVLGSAELAAGDLQAAEEAFKVATRKARGLSEPEQANVWQRLTHLRWLQGCRKDAEELSERAVAAHRTVNDRKRLSQALQKRGVQRFLGHQEGALADLLEALELAEPGTRTYRAAIHNLATALALGAHSPEALGSALQHIRQLRRATRLRSIPGAKLLWIEGLVLGNVWATRRAEVVLKRARDRLAELGAAYAAVLAGLDLAALGLEDDREIAAETLELAKRLGVEGEALAALKLWVDAVHGDGVEYTAREAARQALDACARRRA